VVVAFVVVGLQVVVAFVVVGLQVVVAFVVVGLQVVVAFVVVGLQVVVGFVVVGLQVVVAFVVVGLQVVVAFAVVGLQVVVTFVVVTLVVGSLHASVSCVFCATAKATVKTVTRLTAAAIRGFSFRFCFGFTLFSLHSPYIFVYDRGSHYGYSPARTWP